jgi:hypothetical protein
MMQFAISTPFHVAQNFYGRDARMVIVNPADLHLFGWLPMFPIVVTTWCNAGEYWLM